MKAVHKIAFILLVIGGLNWLLVGLGIWFNVGAGWNVVDALFGVNSVLSSIVYVLVGLSAIVLLCTHKKNCKCCDSSASAPMAPKM